MEVGYMEKGAGLGTVSGDSYGGNKDLATLWREAQAEIASNKGSISGFKYKLGASMLGLL